jgi:Trypsin
MSSTSPRRPLARTAVAAAAAATLAFTLSLPAAAISSYNSEPAPERGEVGALVAQYDHDGDASTPDRVRWFCSGTMISDDVFLSAAHCTTGWPAGTRLGVSLAQDTQAEIDQASAAGLSGDALFDAVAVEGQAHSHPAYPGPSSDTHDIAVLTFDAGGAAQLEERWDGFTPATLPTAGQLDELGPQGLDELDYTIVGYGTQEASREPGGHQHYGGGERLQAPSSFNSLNDAWLRLDMHGSHGNGGACYGDSGGPNFAHVDGDLVLFGTTITGDSPCYATNVTYRMDTPVAREFLDDYVALP